MILFLTCSYRCNNDLQWLANLCRIPLNCFHFYWPNPKSVEFCMTFHWHVIIVHLILNLQSVSQKKNISLRPSGIRTQNHWVKIEDSINVPSRNGSNKLVFVVLVLLCLWCTTVDNLMDWQWTSASTATPLSELERHLLAPYSTKANAFCGLHGSFFPIFFLPNSQKAFAFVEYGTRSCLSGSDRGVVLESSWQVEKSRERNRRKCIGCFKISLISFF